jgi:hypothetical protein
MINRVTDGYSFAVEFEASNKRQFVAKCSAAVSECIGRGVVSAIEVQVLSPVLGHWMSPNYPKSNSPVTVAWKNGRRGFEGVYEKIEAAWLPISESDNAIKSICSDISVARNLTIVR